MSTITIPDDGHDFALLLTSRQKEILAMALSEFVRNHIGTSSGVSGAYLNEAMEMESRLTDSPATPKAEVDVPLPVTEPVDWSDPAKRQKT